MDRQAVLRSRAGSRPRSGWVTAAADPLAGSVCAEMPAGRLARSHAGIRRAVEVDEHGDDPLRCQTGLDNGNRSWQRRNILRMVACFLGCLQRGLAVTSDKTPRITPARTSSHLK